MLEGGQLDFSEVTKHSCCQRVNYKCHFINLRSPRARFNLWLEYTCLCLYHFPPVLCASYLFTCASYLFRLQALCGRIYLLYIWAVHSTIGRANLSKVWGPGHPHPNTIHHGCEEAAAGIDGGGAGGGWWATTLSRCGCSARLRRAPPKRRARGGHLDSHPPRDSPDHLTSICWSSDQCTQFNKIVS